MGSSISDILAILFMDKLENIALSSHLMISPYKIYVFHSQFMSVRKISRLKKGLRCLRFFCQCPARIPQNIIFYPKVVRYTDVCPSVFLCVYTLLFISSCNVLGGYFTCNCVYSVWCTSLRLNSDKFRDLAYSKRGPTTSSVIQVLRNLFSCSL